MLKVAVLYTSCSRSSIGRCLRVCILISIFRVARSFKDYSLSHNPLCLSQKRFARKASAEASSKTGVASSTSLPVADVSCSRELPSNAEQWMYTFHYSRMLCL